QADLPDDPRHHLGGGALVPSRRQARHERTGRPLRHRPVRRPGHRRTGVAAGMNLIEEVRLALHKVADPGKAAAMQGYMKSAMPFLGVQAGPRRAALKQVLTDHPLETAAEWRQAVLRLRREAEYREERNAAIDPTGLPRYRRFQPPDTVPMSGEMTVTGACSDLGAQLAAPRPRGRRAAILSQNRFKSRTDTALLYACIEPSLSDNDFFARKAIGWALRQYAKTNPDEVVRYVEAKGITGLSRREALKNLT